MGKAKPDSGREWTTENGEKFIRLNYTTDNNSVAEFSQVIEGRNQDLIISIYPSPKYRNLTPEELETPIFVNIRRAFESVYYPTSPYKGLPFEFCIPNPYFNNDLFLKFFI